MSTPSIRRIAVEELDRIEPLWNALREHHANVRPDLGPPRSREESWSLRRGQYAAWLEDTDNFLLLAERDDEAVGYAMVHVRSGSATWPLAERTGEIETLSVLPSERGQGTGTELLEEVRRQLRARGVQEIALHVVHTNRDALRFYERHGFDTFALLVRSRGAPQAP